MYIRRRSRMIPLISLMKLLGDEELNWKWIVHVWQWFVKLF